VPLAGSVSRLEKLLRAEFSRLERQAIQVLAGASLERARSEEEPLEVDPAAPLDKRRLAPLLILLGLFRARQLAAAETVIDEAFAVGRTQVLKRLRRPDAPEQPATAALPTVVLQRFRTDVLRLHSDLIAGTARSPGVERLVADSATVGAAVEALTALLDVESFRLSMFAEALVHAAWIAGFRSGAVDATVAALAAGEVPQEFAWTGPDDTDTCQPCHDQFKKRVVARSLADLPDPTTICEFGRACRHAWRVVN
jgi:hypothetical protein